MDAERVEHFECALAERAAEVEAFIGPEAADQRSDTGGEGSGPNGVEAQNSGEDGGRWFGRTARACGKNGSGRAAEAAYGSGFTAGIGDPFGDKGLLDFEDCVDAFGGDVRFGVVVEEQRGVEKIVNGDINLAAAVAIGVQDEGAGGAVSLGQIAVEKIDPVLLGGSAAGGGMLEDVAGGEIGEHLLLRAEEDVAQIDAAAVFCFAHGVP